MHLSLRCINTHTTDSYANKISNILFNTCSGNLFVCNVTVKFVAANTEDILHYPIPPHFPMVLSVVLDYTNVVFFTNG